jgi:ParB/RepB/Spo0J family partition protein
MKTETKIKIEHRPITALRPDPGNPRGISESELEALTRSINEFGLVDPIIARREDSTVIGGHQRLVAARRLGLKTVPVVYVDLTPEKAHLLNVALNWISGDWTANYSAVSSPTSTRCGTTSRSPALARTRSPGC